jgi:group I intron endonuclease
LEYGETMKSGIYCIVNLIDNKKYIGKSKSVNSRKSYHFSTLKNNKHINKHFQNAWNKYGKDNFFFYIIEKCDLEKLNEREKYWISKLKTNNADFGYNVKEGGDGAGIGIINPRFNKGLPEHLIGKGFKSGINHPNFGKKSSFSRSKYFGVNSTINNNRIYWRVRFKVNNKIEYIEYFKTEIEAALAYNDYIIKNNLLKPLNIIE